MMQCSGCSGEYNIGSRGTLPKIASPNATSLMIVLIENEEGDGMEMFSITKNYFKFYIYLKLKIT